MVRVGVLTSSRADFGVYLPLLKAIQKEDGISLEIIAFGTHLSKMHGYTLGEIENNDFTVKHRISSLISDDTENAIATSSALTSLKFSDFWEHHRKDFDIVLCLGDRFEMFSAVISGVPYGIKFAHFYGGDYSEGAMDNVYRDAMTHCSIMHFTSTPQCKNRVELMVNSRDSVDVIGILSIEELENIQLLSKDEFFKKWNIDLNLSTILVTFHPETISPANNIKYTDIIFEFLAEIQDEFQIVITMPNADTNGTIFRKAFIELKETYPNQVHLIENFGLHSYFTCMKYSKLMVGNTSSGISEAGSFNKYFINVGKRQTGRHIGPNVKSVPFDKELLVEQVKTSANLGDYLGENIYKIEGAIPLIINKLKSI